MCRVGFHVALSAYSSALVCIKGHEVDANPYLLDSAVDYVLIRALSMPTSLLLGVLQAALLGAKDSVTPLIAIVYSTAINLVGDFILVNRLNMGLQGAAIATLVAQLAGTAALIAPARKRLVRDHNLGMIKRDKNRIVTGRAFLAFAAPVLTLILGKLAAFGFMTHSAAAVPGQPLPLATHQIILSLFFAVSPFLEVISQTAQTFLPPYFAPVKDYVTSMLSQDPKYDSTRDDKVKPWMTASMMLSTRLVRLGLIVATAVSAIASLVPAYFGNFITSDVNVQVAVKPLAKYLLAGSFLAAPVAVSEGILLARRELKFLASVYLVSTALLPAALIWVKKIGGNVQQVWGCFAAFQLFRAFCFVGRIYGGSFLAQIMALFQRKVSSPPKALNFKTTE
jgi:Na+-driven multidrug efflux pump